MKYEIGTHVLVDNKEYIITNMKKEANFFDDGYINNFFFESKYAKNIQGTKIAFWAHERTLSGGLEIDKKYYREQKLKELGL